MSDVQTRIPAAPAIKTVTDSLGRVLAVRGITPDQQLDLFEAAGDQSNNGPWLGMAMLAACVIEIDSVPMPAPTNKGQIRNALRRLGSEGVSAVAKAMKPADDEAEQAATDIVATAKN